MATELKEYLRSNPPKGFKPVPFYSKDGDFLSFFFEDADHYAHRVDHVLTVYLEMKSNRLVGFKIKGVQRILRTLGRFNLTRTVPDGKKTVRLKFLLMAPMSVAANDEHMDLYEEVEEATPDLELDEELQPA